MDLQDKKYMSRAIELAQKGEGWCHPNPMVGAVIVKHGRIIGEGYHQRCGELHAERNAIASLKESAEGAAMYVTLEPCCHWGRTPPCTEAILQSGITRVVIGSRDPNPKVNEGGVRALRLAGIEVEQDVMRKECDAINPVFFHYIQTQLPYLIMKYAMTMDGKIATHTGESKWITGEAARQEVHWQRHACMGIMCGIGTVRKDDPILNCRIKNGRDPIRIICDSQMSISLKSQIVRTARLYPTILAVAISGCQTGEINVQEVPAGYRDKISELRKSGITILNVPQRNKNRVDLKQLMFHLGKREIDSILLEGGGILNEAALSAGIVNEVRLFIAPKIFGGSGKSPVEGAGVNLPIEAYRFQFGTVERYGEDIMIRCYPNKEVEDVYRNC